MADQVRYGFRTAFVVEAVYAPDAATKREPFRGDHLTRLGKLIAEGALASVGAFDDMSASLLVVTVDTEDAAKAIVEADVYWKNGVWVDYELRKLNLLEVDGVDG